MHEFEEEIDDVERCRQARRALERRFRTLEALCAHIQREEKKSARNIAMARRLLCQRDAKKAQMRHEPLRSHRAAVARRCA